jgi:hypothetical protein
VNKQKGSDFERQICKDLSLWWSGGERDDIFWRTSLSGGRATVRRKSGKKTDLQCGDISAIDPYGVPLIQQVTFELKRGYGKASPFDLLDANHTSSLEWLLFLKQAQTAAASAQTPYWAIIFQRDRHTVCIAIPLSMWTQRGRAVQRQNRIIVRVQDIDLIVLTYSGFKEAFSPEWFHSRNALGESFDD